MKNPVVRTRVPRAQREQQMLAVAEEVFGERGYQAASMEEIAGRVGVTKPMLYEYFGSKDGLLRACLQRARQQLLDRTGDAVAAGGRPRDVVQRAVQAFFEFVDDHAAAWSVLQNEAALASGTGGEEIEGIRRQQSEHTQALLASLPGSAGLGVLDLQVRAEIVIGACERVAVWRTVQERPPSAEQAATLVMDALGPGLLGADGERQRS